MIMKHIILASNSPRRRELLAGLDLDFEVKVLPDIDESYPKTYLLQKWQVISPVKRQTPIEL